MGISDEMISQNFYHLYHLSTNEEAFGKKITQFCFQGQYQSMTLPIKKPSMGGKKTESGTKVNVNEYIANRCWIIQQQSHMQHTIK